MHTLPLLEADLAGDFDRLAARPAAGYDLDKGLYWWEVVVLVRKISVVFVYTILPEADLKVGVCR